MQFLCLYIVDTSGNTTIKLHIHKWIHISFHFIYMDYYYSLQVFQISNSWWSFTRVSVKASLLKYSGLFSVFWLILAMLWFRLLLLLVVVVVAVCFHTSINLTEFQVTGSLVSFPDSWDIFKCSNYDLYLAESVGAVEYTNCISADR